MLFSPHSTRVLLSTSNEGVCKVQERCVEGGEACFGDRMNVGDVEKLVTN